MSRGVLYAVLFFVFTVFASIATVSCSSGKSSPHDENITDDDGVVSGNDRADETMSEAGEMPADDFDDVLLSSDEDAFLFDAESEPIDEDVVCQATFSGMYDIIGQDGIGTYIGVGEVRETGYGVASVIRTIRYDEPVRWNGYRVAQAMTGTIAGDYRGLYLYFKLDAGGFVAQVNGNMRPVPEVPIIGLAGPWFSAPGCGAYQTTVTPAAPATEGGFSERWVWREPPGDAPLWENERVEIPANPEPSAAEKATIYQTYASFHALATVQPYLDRDDFKKMVHYMIVDPTDRNFLHDNPDTIRVIQRPVNDWTLAEAEMRHSAFAHTLAEKAVYFSDVVQETMINELGMMAHWNDALQRYEQDGDSLLWTGVYVATMAWRYLLDHSSEAFERMIKSLEGILLCVEIVPDKTTFARTVRLHVDDGDPEFHEGTGQYTGIDWKEGGNNDMFKGIIIGAYWGWIVLTGSTDPRAPTLRNRLLNMLVRLHDHCEIARDLRMNQLAISLLLYMMTKGTLSEAIYKNESQTIWNYVSTYVEQGGVPINEYGISDWSGNHLGVWEFFILREAYAAVGDGTRVGDLQAALYEKGDAMRPARQGLFQLIVGAVGVPQSPEDIASGIERLHEVPLVRGLYPVDRRWSPDFCVSPIPELFWKNDWTTSDRTQSLRAYPLYEMGTSNYYWKDNIYKGIVGGVGTGGDTGLDFLVGYWFARRYGLVSETD